MIQEDLPNENMIGSDLEGVLWSPEPDTGAQVGYFSNTCAPMIPINFSWNSVKVNWTRSTAISPSDFSALFSIYGIRPDAEPILLMEKLVTDIGTEETEDLFFDLRTNRGQASLKNSGTATSGKIQANLPLEWDDYVSCQLKRAWFSDWAKRKRIPITGSSSRSEYAHTLREIAVTYDSDMNADFSDVRFVGPDGRTPLCYERESYTASTSAVFNVLVPEILIGSTTNLYMYYGNSGGSYAGNPFNIYQVFDDFEDGAYKGVRSPYPVWTKDAGTLAMETGSPISGTYSLKFTGPGAPAWVTTPYNYPNPRSIRSDFDLKVTAYGSGGNNPYVKIYTKMQDENNYLVAYFYYTSPNSYLKVRTYTAGTGSDVSSVTWLSGAKVPLNTTYHFTIIDSGSNIKIYVNDVLKLNTNYSLNLNYEYYGFGVNGSEAIVVDNFRASSPYNSGITVGSAGSEESTITVDPDTPGNTDRSILYTKPADWTDNSPACLLFQPRLGSLQESEDTLISGNQAVDLGPSGLDLIDAIRLGVLINADEDYNVRFNRLEYALEV